jgi:hypothetical protein
MIRDVHRGSWSLWFSRFPPVNSGAVSSIPRRDRGACIMTLPLR